MATRQHTISVDVTQHDPPSMFLHRDISTAEGEGFHITAALGMAGDPLIITIEQATPGGDKAQSQYIVSFVDIARTIAKLHFAGPAPESPTARAARLWELLMDQAPIGRPEIDRVRDDVAIERVLEAFGERAVRNARERKIREQMDREENK